MRPDAEMLQHRHRKPYTTQKNIPLSESSGNLICGCKGVWEM
jgi:hypothetical protein